MPPRSVPTSPRFHSEFLTALWAALERRRKALRYRVRGLGIEAVGEAAGPSDAARTVEEKIEVDCPLPGVPRTSVRLFAWSDRWCWIDARSRPKSKPWTWEFTREGRPLAPPEQLVAALEASIDAASPANRDPHEELNRIWRPLLAAGPRPL